MPGHLFLSRGHVERLACSAALVPAKRPPERDAPAALGVPGNEPGDSQPTRISTMPADRFADSASYVRALADFLDEASSRLGSEGNGPDRACPLFAAPWPGQGPEDADFAQHGITLLEEQVGRRNVDLVLV